jgi:hypothetical protein
VGSLHPGVAEVRPTLAAGHIEDPVTHWERHVIPGWAVGRTVRLDDLRVSLGSAEPRSPSEQRAADHVRRQAGDLLGSVTEGVVDLGAELAPYDDEHGD